MSAAEYLYSHGLLPVGKEKEARKVIEELHQIVELEF